MNHTLESRFLGAINNLKYVDDTSLMAESEEELKRLLLKVKGEQAGLKLSIQNTKVIAHRPSLHGKQMGKNGNSDRFYFPGLQSH